MKSTRRGRSLSLAPLTHSLAPHCSLRSRAPLIRSLTRSRAQGKEVHVFEMNASISHHFNALWTVPVSRHKKSSYSISGAPRGPRHAHVARAPSAAAPRADGGAGDGSALQIQKSIRRILDLWLRTDMPFPRLSGEKPLAKLLAFLTDFWNSLSPSRKRNHFVVF